MMNCPRCKQRATFTFCGLQEGDAICPAFALYNCSECGTTTTGKNIGKAFGALFCGGTRPAFPFTWTHEVPKNLRAWPVVFVWSERDFLRPDEKGHWTCVCNEYGVSRPRVHPHYTVAQILSILTDGGQ
jgi:hypothetical protein